MDTRRRMPLQDLPLEQFISQDPVKTPRKHKRPLSPSRSTLLNPAKRRVLDAEGIPLSNTSPILFTLPNMRSMTPTRPSRLGNGLARHHTRPQGTLSPLSAHQLSPSRELYPKPTIESSTDPQSRHYPGFDIFRDAEHRWDPPVPRVFLPSDSTPQSNRSEEEKENTPLRKRAKKPSSKRRLLASIDGLDVACPITPAHPERTPFSTRQTLR